MERLDHDTFRLSSGREFSANAGIIGLKRDIDDASLSTYEGYDGSLNTDGYDFIEPPEPGWTAAEKAELAAYMVELWSEWGAVTVKILTGKEPIDASA